MTDIERNEYNSQSKDWRDAFDRIENDHPNWNFSQCQALATIETGIGGWTPESGPGTIETVLIRARDYMKVNFPNTFFKVARVLDPLIDLVKKKIINTWEKIKIWFNSI